MRLPPLEKFGSHKSTDLTTSLTFCWQAWNWGSKWDVFDFDIMERNDEKEVHQAKLGFCTAWNPPKSWLLEAGRLFPDLGFFLEFYFEESFSSGTLNVQWGVPLSGTFQDEVGEFSLWSDPTFTNFDNWAIEWL